MSAEVFAFRFTSAYRLAALPFGIRPGGCEVRVDEETLAADFGPWRLRTPRSNVAEVAVTGPYAFWKTAGPAHLGLSDRGLTFASNGLRGVRIRFHAPVSGIEPLGVIRHPELTVTVTDVDGLARSLRS